MGYKKTWLLIGGVYRFLIVGSNLDFFLLCSNNSTNYMYVIDVSGWNGW